MQIRIEAAKRTPYNRRGASRGKINQDIKGAGDDVDVVVGYLNQCYHGIPLNQSGIKVITAPIKRDRQGRGIGKCDGSRGLQKCPTNRSRSEKRIIIQRGRDGLFTYPRADFHNDGALRGFKLKCCLRRYLNPQRSLSPFVFRTSIVGKKTANVRRTRPYLPDGQ